MFRLKDLKRTFAIAVPILALGLMSGDLALAQKKGGGGGAGGGNTGGGTIYFDSYALGGFHQMNSDGSGKTPLPIPAGEPSNHLHNGHRWFLALEIIEGETNPGGDNYRSELFAYRDDGVRLQLTNDPNLEAIGYYLFDTVRWQPGDARISWIAQRWVDGEVVDSGIYEAELIVDESDDLIGLDIDTISLLVPEIGIATHDWSPDGTRIVYDVVNELGAHELYIADLLLQQISLLTTSPGKLPDWSPDGSKIAFQKAVFRGGISTINPDGTGLADVIRPTGRSVSPQVYRPRWSPTGSHLIYALWGFDEPFYTSWQYVYRATANGGSKANLTSNTDHSVPVGWR
ncbi:MAG: hypothetical protein WD669_09915 [Pirellulales bacterium]